MFCVPYRWDFSVWASQVTFSHVLHKSCVHSFFTSYPLSASLIPHYIHQTAEFKLNTPLLRTRWSCGLVVSETMYSLRFTTKARIRKPKPRQDFSLSREIVFLIQLLKISCGPAAQSMVCGIVVRDRNVFSLVSAQEKLRSAESCSIHLEARRSKRSPDSQRLHWGWLSVAYVWCCVCVCLRRVLGALNANPMVW